MVRWRTILRSRGTWARRFPTTGLRGVLYTKPLHRALAVRIPLKSAKDTRERRVFRLRELARKASPFAPLKMTI